MITSLTRNPFVPEVFLLSRPLKGAAVPMRQSFGKVDSGQPRLSL